MSSLLDLEKEEEDGQDSEITLTTASLLGIFFGLVLICAVFFGLGYSLGRGGIRSTPTAAPTAENPTDDAPPQPVAQESQQSPPDLQPQESDASAGSSASASGAEPAQTVTVPILASDSAASEQPSQGPSQDESAQAEDASAEEPAAAPRPMAKTPTARMKTVNTATATSGRTMVQIAAVSRREDADALVAALRQHGFNVVVIGGQQDNLLHVQIGPFSSRAEANHMKQRLLSSGYNAIVKQ